MFTVSNTVMNESRNTASRKPIYTAVFMREGAAFLRSNQLRSGERWVVGSEIFWKARGDHGWFSEAVIACVFKKFMSRLPNGRPQASGWSVALKYTKIYEGIGI
jgi:hypothetical protein